MKERRLAWAVAVALTLLGCAGIVARLRSMRQARLDWGATVWRLTYDVSFLARGLGGRLRVALPYDTQHARVIREEFTRPGLRMDLVRGKRTVRREAVAVARAAESIRFLAEFDIHVSPESKWSRDDGSKKMSASVRASYLQSEKLIQTTDPAILGVMSRLRDQRGDRSLLVERAFEYCTDTIAQSSGRGPADAATVLRDGIGTTEGRARAMVALCRAGGMPARLVAGFILHGLGTTNPHVWVEVYGKKKGGWLPYDPERGYSGELPASYLPVRRGGVEIIRFQDAELSQVRFSVRRLQPISTYFRRDHTGPMDVAFLTRLPYAMQQTLAVLLLLPLGALITSFFRNFVGVQTFGTFTPSLLALSFIHADWRAGILVFVVVMAFGLGGRALLERIKILMVPRLSVILTFVVLILVLQVSVLDYLRMTPSAHAVLLPMVILTVMIERFHISAEEDSPRFALKLLAGTLAVASCCFALFQWRTLGRLALSFPEGQLLVAAVLILIGRYTGYRLTELIRFRDIVAARSSENHR